MTEAQVHQNVADYLKLQYRDVIFWSNAEDSRKRHVTDQARIKRLNSGRARPDLEVFAPRAGFHGLVIEIKKDNKQLFKADGKTYKSDHIQEQALMLLALRQMGYMAEFGEGFDHCKAILDEYLALPKPNYAPPQYEMKRPVDPDPNEEPF
jgi:hypothetical protein